METVLWQVLAGTRGGVNRTRILHALEERPRNANQLAEDLELNYDTVRHHLEVLEDNDVVDSSGDDYGAVYLPSETARRNWDLIEEITDQLDT
jgi:DNA-binding transcriptional ArsR family regulator